MKPDGERPVADPLSPQVPMTGEESVDELARARLGSVLRGKYRLDRVLGIGGMATVYASTHRNTKQFAIKVLHPEFSTREDIRKRFLREGYLANSIGHSGAVVVLDDDVAEDGSAFLVMELLHGSSVDALWTEQGGSLPIPLVLALAHQLLDVLAAAHAHGVFHRDLKPANLFVTKDGVLKVLDFGIARLQQASPAITATASGMTLGTPAFMPPEQASGRSGEVDARSDLWAVGATLFVLISGQLVHEGDNSRQLMIMAATRPARPLGSVVPAAPGAVASLIDRALAFQKGDRWQTAAEMRTALEQAHVATFGSPVSSHWLRLATSNTAERANVAVEQASSPASSIPEGARGAAPEESSPPGAVSSQPAAAVPSPQLAAIPSAPRGEAPAAHAAAHIEVNIASNQDSGPATHHLWLAVGALLLIIGLMTSALWQRSSVPPGSPATLDLVTESQRVFAPDRAQSAPSLPSTPTQLALTQSAPAAPAASPAPKARETAGAPRQRTAQSVPRPAAAPAPECRQLLELQSLGEALSADQRTFLRERCKG